MTPIASSTSPQVLDTLKLVGLSVLLAVAGWTGAGVLHDFWAAVSHPAPLVYTEGVMMWASQEIDRGNSPYGAIDSIPSRYFCYGPAMPWLVSLVAQTGPGYAVAGRLAAGAFLLAGGWFCYLLSRKLGAGQVSSWAGAIFYFSAVFCSHHAWSFRVDTLVTALGIGGTLASVAWAKAGGKSWLWVALICGVVGGMTKVTSGLWGLWIFLLCGGAGALEMAARAPRGFRLSLLWKSFGGGGFYLGGCLGGMVVVGIFYPGAIGDQLFNQIESGINPWGYSRNTLIDAVKFSTFPWLVVLLNFLFGGSMASRAGGVAAASWLLASAMLMKFGGDVNYFFDSFALVSTAAAVAGAERGWRAGWVNLAWSLLGFYWLAGTGLSNMPHRLTGEAAQRELVAARETTYLFRGQASLTEDPFFPVYHGGTVLVSDPFQASLSPSFAEAAKQESLNSGRIVAGDRIARALGGAMWGNYSGTQWTLSAGVPGMGVYMPCREARAIKLDFPHLKFQATPSELRFFAEEGEVLDWEGVAKARERLGKRRTMRFIGEIENPLEWLILSGGGGTGGW